MCVLLFFHIPSKRGGSSTRTSLSLLVSTPVTIHSESPPFVCILLCCHVLPPPLLQEKDNGRPRTETHAKYTTTYVESAGFSNHSRNHIHNGLHHISMWSSTSSSALDVHLPGIGARTRSFDLFVCCWSFSSGFECGFIYMYDPPYADEQSPPLALCGAPLLRMSSYPPTHQNLFAAPSLLVCRRHLSHIVTAFVIRFILFAKLRHPRT